MKILLLTTYPHGGAGTACRRLQKALQTENNTVDMLTSEHLNHPWPFYAERLSFLPFERDKSVRFSFSPANFGHNLTQHPLVQNADILHLHWINQGFLSLENIRQLAQLNKPILWTLHDMWAFTGGCHYSGECLHYQQSCGGCPLLRRPGAKDFSHRIWNRKKNAFPDNIQIVTCSQWLASLAQSSSLLGKFSILPIPNPIDVDVFKPLTNDERLSFRKKIGVANNTLLLLFVAMKVGDARKGFEYLLEALLLLKASHPTLAVEVLVMGKSNPDDLARLPYPFHPMGMIKDAGQIASVYAIADTFVIPSLEDNLPNTVMESIACGTPVVGFNTGGIPEMVEHQREGYLAPQRDSAELAKGIYWINHGTTPVEQLREAARQKALKHYANPVVASQYLELYQNMLTAQAEQQKY
jgi:glycosyltransferase involved in cell wall biosynthesis